MAEGAGNRKGLHQPDREPYSHIAKASKMNTEDWRIFFMEGCMMFVRLVFLLRAWKSILMPV